MKDKKIYCPVNGWDCPYWQKDGSCTIEDPINEWDDFGVFWDPEDEYWEELINAGDAFCKKYGNSIFSRKLIMAFIEKLEEESKRRMRTQWKN